MTNDQRVTVTAHDPVSGDRQTQPLNPDSYVLVVGEHMELTRTQHYGSGTVVLTIKPRERS